MYQEMSILKDLQMKSIMILKISIISGNSRRKHQDIGLNIVTYTNTSVIFLE